MGGRFACPECGAEIAVTGLTPGREVICPSCSTLVEVPYLPRVVARPKRWDFRPRARRAGGSRRGRTSLAQRRRARWALALAAVAGVALATWGAVGLIGSQAQSDRERVLRELIAASTAAEAAHDPGAAFREITAAVTQARKIDPDGSPRLDDLLRRRDRAARAEVRARLAALDRLGVDQRVGEAQILADRARHDPALEPLAASIAAGVEVSTRQQVAADCARGRVALRAGQGPAAFAAAERALGRAGRLADRADSDRWQAEARVLLIATVERCGVATTAIAPAPGGDPQAGASDGFAAASWAAALAARGYLPLPAGSPWGEIWAAHAPFLATSRVVESRDDLYLQSQNRVTRIDGQFAVTRRGQPVWSTRVYAQTRTPMLDLPAYLAGKLATADRRDPEAERRFRDDARTAFRIQADRIFRGITPVPPGEGDPGSEE